MREPRCGNKDLRRIQRRKRYILQGISNLHFSFIHFNRDNLFLFQGSRWPSNEPLTFRIVKYPTTFPQQFVDTELTKALKVDLVLFYYFNYLVFCSFSYGAVHQALNSNIEN